MVNGTLQDGRSTTRRPISRFGDFQPWFLSLAGRKNYLQDDESCDDSCRLNCTFSNKPHSLVEFVPVMAEAGACYLGFSLEIKESSASRVTQGEISVANPRPMHIEPSNQINPLAKPKLFFKTPVLDWNQYQSSYPAP